MTADEDRQVPAVHVEDEFAFIAVVLVDAHVLLAKIGEDALDEIHCEICDCVELGVVQLAVSLVVLTQAGVFVVGARSDRGHLFDLFCDVLFFHRVLLV